MKLELASATEPEFARILQTIRRHAQENAGTLQVEIKSPITFSLRCPCIRIEGCEEAEYRIQAKLPNGTWIGVTSFANVANLWRVRRMVWIPLRADSGFGGRDSINGGKTCPDCL